ncbi:hypothetical protein [Aeromonas salmonicida]|uniref:hypothetical protein n=1 Tax=Aeromonas salmonicida TaxID=645 RepID=UPI0024A9053F|nr:hypothetical protein [Aeromonas salmonicida]MDM5137614.1 hypothetical protein [Aeromonas salmonicida]WHF40524.1 hypothetical protein QJ050_17490 [Aeromonas salmonicida]
MTDKHRMATNSTSMDGIDFFKHDQFSAQESLVSMFEKSMTFNIFVSSVDVLLEGVSESSNSSSSLVVQKKVQPDYRELIEALPWAYDFYTTAKDLDSARKLVPFYKEINDLISINSLEHINDFLYYIDTEYMSDVLLPGILRLTLTKRKELKYWDVLKVRVASELTARGHDASNMLRGLE